VNRGDYLDIQTDGPDEVKWNGLAMSVTQVRLYQPSIHLFNGSQAAAELIIQHGGAGQNLLVCIPIQINTGAGPSNKFFSQIIPYISSSHGESQNVNVSNWSLNQVLNYNVPYYYYLGTFPYDPCNGSNNIVVFDLQQSAKMNQSDFDILSSQLSKTSVPKVSPKSTGMLIYNSSGAQNPTQLGGTSDDFEIVNCVPISGMDDSTDDTQGSMWGKLSGPTGPTAIIAYIFIGLFLWCFIVFVLYPLIRDKLIGGGGGGGAAGGGGGGGGGPP